MKLILIFGILISAFVVAYDGKQLLDPGKIKRSYYNVFFALRGPIHHRTVEIVEELKKGTSGKRYTEVIRTGIVDSQAMGQKPLTFLRQLLVFVNLPYLGNYPGFPSDVVQRGNELLSDMTGHSTGSYTPGKGLKIVRRKVQEYISKRDGFPVSFHDIYLIEGVTEGVELSLNVVERECKEADVGIMTPNPLYPLYAALLTKLDLVKIKYNLNPDENWVIDVEELERSYRNATCHCNCKPRVLLIINPQNPTSKILRRSRMEDIVKFAYRHNLILFVDEVYQKNIFQSVPFISMNKIIHDMGTPYNTKIELISFNSISKGYTAEIGLRGGYMHVVNMAEGVHAVLNNLLSIKQCPNAMGQVGLSVLVQPPQVGQPSYDLYNQEVREYYQSHKAVAKFLVSELNKLEGYNCSEIEGGPAAFTKFKIPKRAVREAETRGMFPDIFYGLELLEQVGLNVAVGSAFGFASTQHYMRLALPVNVSDAEKAIARLKQFHEGFMIQYA